MQPNPFTPCTLWQQFSDQKENGGWYAGSASERAQGRGERRSCSGTRHNKKNVYMVEHLLLCTKNNPPLSFFLSQPQNGVVLFHRYHACSSSVAVLSLLWRPLRVLQKIENRGLDCTFTNVARIAICAAPSYPDSTKKRGDPVSE